MAKPPSSPERLRLTIAVTPEVHETFQRMADATGISLSRAMGDWLADTIEGAQLLTSQIERAKAAPRTVLREMQAGLTGVHGEITQLLDDLRTGKKVLPAAGGGAARDAAGTRSAAAAAASPRLVIRGGKSPVSGEKANHRTSRGAK